LFECVNFGPAFGESITDLCGQFLDFFSRSASGVRRFSVSSDSAMASGTDCCHWIRFHAAAAVAATDAVYSSRLVFAAGRL
jgi:hypothetical protein